MRFLSKLGDVPDSVDDAIGMLVLIAIPCVMLGIGHLCAAGM